MSLIPVKVVYRSRYVQFPLVCAMEASNAWERSGLDLVHLDFVSGAAKADPMLFSGEVDFIFGSHITPYIHKANGIPIVYVGQTVNWVDDVLVSSKPIHSISELRGKVIADKKLDRLAHPHGNHRLYLQREHVDLSQVDFLESGKTPMYQAVADGKADAAFVSPPEHLMAKELGLYVQYINKLPMVMATTLTTMWPTTVQRPELVRALIKAVREGIRFFKYEEKQMMKVMEEKVGPGLGITNRVILEDLYHRNKLLYNESLYPRLDSIENAFRIANFVQPGLHEKIHPIELWNMHFLREIDAELAV